MVALFNRSAIRYAWVLLVVSAMYAVLSGRGMFHLYPYIDAFSIYPLAYLVWMRPTWWGLTVTGCAGVSVLFQLVYWFFYANGFYVAGLFKFGLTGIFLVAILALLWGGGSVGDLIGCAYRFYRSSVLHDSGRLQPACVSGRSGSEEA